VPRHSASASAKTAVKKTAKKRPRCSPHVRIGRSNTGLGMFATGSFKKGDFIAEYWGRKLRDAEADATNSKYLFELNSRWTIDGTTRRNKARYINHSCRPNADPDVGRGRIIIRAKKTIHPGEEITYNYGKNYFDTFISPHGCRCAACAAKPVRKVSARKKAKVTKRKVKKKR
jgi:SET domain-containing protein